MATTRPGRHRPAASRQTRAPEPAPEPVLDAGAPVGADLISSENRAILHHAIEEAARLLRSDGAMAYVMDATSGLLRFADDAGIADEDGRRWVRGLSLRPGVGLFGRAVADRRVVLTGDYPNDPGFVHFNGADRAVESLAIHSFLVAPLIAADRVFGAMGTYAKRIDAFDENDIALVRALADHAAAAMANVDLIAALAGSRAEIERRADAERALREIGGRITSLRQPAEVLQLAVDEAARLLGADGARIDLLSEKDGALYWAHDATTGRLPGLGPIAGSGAARAGEGISGRAVREMRPVFTGDYLADDRFEHADAPDDHVRRNRIRSVVAVPLIWDRGPLGTLTVYTGSIDAFSQADAELIEALAGQATIAMTNARLIEELAASRSQFRRRAEAEQALREIAARITAIRDPSEVLQDVVDEAARLLEAERVRIDLIGPEAGRVGWTHMGAGDHIGGAAVDHGGIPYAYGASGKAIVEARTVVVGDYFADTSFEHDPDLDEAVRADQVRALIVTPMIAEDDLLGVLQVGSEHVDAFGPDQVALAEALAHQAAIAIHNSRLVQALERSAEEIRRRARAEQALREIATRITAIRDPGELLQSVTDAARELLDGERAQLDIVDPATNKIRWSHASGDGKFGGDLPGTREGVAAEVGINAAAIAAGRTVRTGDYLGDERIHHLPESDDFVRRVGIRSVVAAPLSSEGALLGILKVATTRADAFDDEDAALMGAFADQVVVAIQNARLIDELGRSREEIGRRAEAERAVREIAADISTLRDVDEILQQTVDQARTLLDSASARIDMLQDDGQLHWAYASGEDAVRTRDTGLDATFRVGEGIAGLTVQTGQTFSTGDYLADERFCHIELSDNLVRVTGFRSVLSSPLRSEAGSLGALSVSSKSVNAYDENQAAILQGLADQAAIAIQNARLIAELNRSRSELARRAEAEGSLREIAAQITAIRDTGSLLQQVVDAAKRLIDADGSILDLIDPEVDILRWAYDSGVSRLFTAEEIAALTIPIGVGALGKAVSEDRVISGNDDLGSHFPPSQENDRFWAVTGFRSMIIAPITGESGPLGAVEVYSREPNAFDDDDAAVIRSLAAQAAIAITNARLIAELERSQRELEARAETERSLRDIAARITSLSDPGDILARVVEESRRLLGSDGAHLTRISEDGTFLVPVIVAGGMDAETEGWLKQMRFPLGGGINGLAAEEIQPIWTQDYAADPRIPHELDDDLAAERLGLRSMAAAPLRAPGGEVIGTLAVSYRLPRDFVPDELDLLQGLADQAAIALTNANLYELLGESEGRYRHLVENSPDLVWSIDAEARFTFLSETIERLTGWRPVDLIGKHFGDLVHESSREVAEIDWTAGIVAGARELRGRVNLLHRDGHPVPAEFIAFGTLDETGAFAGANGSVRDMTDRERLERELRESEARFRFLIQNSPDIIFAVDPDGRFTYLSDTIRRSLGIEPEALIGTRFVDLIAYQPDEVPGERFAMMAADPDLELTNLIHLKAGDGRILPFEVSSVGVRRDGAFGGIQGAARDVTERTRLERELRTSEERYRFLVENSPDVVFSTDHEGNFTYLSETIERMTGHPPSELVGGHFSRIVDEHSLPAAFERWTALSTNPEVEQVVRLNLRHIDGGLVPVEVSAIGTTVDGAFVGIHGSTRDISFRERLERDLRRQAAELASSQERAHLARELHDSVTQALFSMTLITRSTELLIDRDTLAAKDKLGSLRELQREALAEMRALIFELRPGNLEQDGLLAALRTHTAALQGRIGLPILVTSELTERLPLGVEEVLYRIAQEALHNVVKHAAAHQVRLILDRPAGGGVLLRIQDDGKGFDTGSVPEGHLGLAGMRARADKIGGVLTVASGPGQGTTIEVRVSDEAVARAAADGAAAAPVQPEPERVRNSGDGASAE